MSETTPEKKPRRPRSTKSAVRKKVNDAPAAPAGAPANQGPDPMNAALQVLTGANLIPPPNEQGTVNVPLPNLALANAAHAVSAQPGAMRDLHLTVSLICILLGGRGT